MSYMASQLMIAIVLARFHGVALSLTKIFRRF
jgi:hypothetical protein